MLNLRYIWGHTVVTPAIIPMILYSAIGILGLDPKIFDHPVHHNPLYFSARIVPDCTVPLPQVRNFTWNSQELWVWNRLCRGEPADLREFHSGHSCNIASDDPWPQSSTIRAELIMAMIQYPRLREVLSQRGVWIDCANIVGDIDLQFAHINFPLIIEQSWFHQSVTLAHLNTSAFINFQGSRFDESLSFNSVQTNGPIFLRNGARFVDIDFRGANIAAVIDFRDSRIGGALNAAELQVNGDLFFRDARFQSIDLTDARIEGSAIMDGISIENDLIMSGVRITGNLSLQNHTSSSSVYLLSARIDGNIELNDSIVTGQFYAAELHGGENLIVTDSRLVDLNIVNSWIEGSISIIRVNFNGNIDADSTVVGRHFVLRNSHLSRLNLFGVRIGEYAEILYTHISNNFNLQYAHISNYLSVLQSDLSNIMLDHSSISGNIDFIGGGHPEQIGDDYQEDVNQDSNPNIHDIEEIRYGSFHDISMDAAHIGGNLVICDTRISGSYFASGVSINGDFQICGYTILSGEMRLDDSHVQGGILFCNSDFQSEIDMSGFSAGSFVRFTGSRFRRILMTSSIINSNFSIVNSNFFGDLDASRLRVENGIYFRGSSFREINITHGHIGRALSLNGAIFHGAVNLSGAIVDGEFQLGRSSVISQSNLPISVEDRPPRWLTDASLLLRNVQVQILQDTEDSWNLSNGHLDLVGFRYALLGGTASPQDSLATRPVSWLLGWLEKQMGSEIVFIPQPYEQLSQVLRASGYTFQSNQIRFAMYEQQRVHMSTPIETYILLTLSRFIIGYAVGYYILIGLFWYAVVVAIGSAIVHIDMDADTDTKRGKMSNFLMCFFYSLDMAMPAVALNKKAHDQITEKLSTLIIIWVYFERMAGLVLITIIIASFTGLIGG